MSKRTSAPSKVAINPTVEYSASVFISRSTMESKTMCVPLKAVVRLSMRKVTSRHISGYIQARSRTTASMRTVRLHLPLKAI